MRIAYCEDEMAQAGLVRSMMEHWAKRRDVPVEVVLFESAEEFLFKHDNVPCECFSYDAVFLDIAMRQMNGMELAHAIRKRDKKLPIAFLTADNTFAIEGYEVRAVRYLLKPITAKKLDSLLDELLAAQENSSEETICITIGENGATKRIAEDDICYVEVLGHYTHLHLAEAAAIRIKESLTAVVQRFHRKDKFVKCHRSYVVNLAYVEKISRSECTLSDSTVLPVSRSAYQNFNERFIQYYRGSYS